MNMDQCTVLVGLSTIKYFKGSNLVPTSTRKEFSEGAENLAPSILSLFLLVNEVLDEPEDITNALAILETLQIHRL